MEVNFERKNTFLDGSPGQIHNKFHRSFLNPEQVVLEIIFLITGNFKVRNTPLRKHNITSKQGAIN